jgi:hypothetical protein
MWISKSSFLLSVNSSFVNDCWIVFGNMNAQSALIWVQCVRGIILYFLSIIESFGVV